jgi:hypothetical protein
MQLLEAAEVADEALEEADDDNVQGELDEERIAHEHQGPKALANPGRVRACRARQPL